MMFMLLNCLPVFLLSFDLNAQVLRISQTGTVLGTVVGIGLG